MKKIVFATGNISKAKRFSEGLLKNDIEYRRNNRYQEQEYVDVVEEINESDELKVND